MRNLYEQLAHLVPRCVAGDVQAYAQLVTLTQDRVLAAARAVVRSEHDAEDAAQEAYLRAYRRLDSLRDPQSLVAWLTQTARRCALDQLRKPVLAPMRPRPESCDHLDEQRVALSRAVVQLSSDDRRLFERYYLAGHTTARLAADLRVTDAAVRKRLERIRQRLRKEIAMPPESSQASPPPLPQRIIDLLARPILTDLPENPVGAVWDDLRAALPEYEVLTLPEQVRLADAERFYGDAVRDPIRRRLHMIDDEHFLRGDVTLPMLIAAVGRPVGAKLITTGKVYRNSAADATRMQHFHQAEAMWIGERLDDFALTGWLMDTLHRLLGQNLYQIERERDDIGGVCLWEVYARWQDRWTSVASFGAARAETVRALGHDPSRVSVVGVCFGLERLASLRYGIDDIRKVEAARVDEA